MKKKKSQKMIQSINIHTIIPHMDILQNKICKIAKFDLCYKKTFQFQMLYQIVFCKGPKVSDIN